jgi:hypothetical protein
MKRVKAAIIPLLLLANLAVPGGAAWYAYSAVKAAQAAENANGNLSYDLRRIKELVERIDVADARVDPVALPANAELLPERFRPSNDAVADEISDMKDEMEKARLDAKAAALDAERRASDADMARANAESRKRLDALLGQ